MLNVQRCQHHTGTGPWRSISFLMSIEGSIRCQIFRCPILKGLKYFHRRSRNEGFGTEFTGMCGDSSGYWKSWAVSPSQQWQYGFSNEPCPPTAREISNMGSQWLLSWTTTGKARLRSLFLIIKLILALSWTRGNTRVEKVDYFASFSCFLTNLSSQINW